jgi:hypothetical protein
VTGGCRISRDNYHRNWDGEPCRRDQIRSRCLSEMGWDIMRFWVYELRDTDGVTREGLLWTVEASTEGDACAKILCYLLEFRLIVV